MEGYNTVTLVVTVGGWSRTRKEEYDAYGRSEAFTDLEGSNFTRNGGFILNRDFIRACF